MSASAGILRHVATTSGGCKSARPSGGCQVSGRYASVGQGAAVLVQAAELVLVDALHDPGGEEALEDAADAALPAGQRDVVLLPGAGRCGRTRCASPQPPALHGNPAHPRWHGHPDRRRLPRPFRSLPHPPGVLPRHRGTEPGCCRHHGPGARSKGGTRRTALRRKRLGSCPTRQTSNSPSLMAPRRLDASPSPSCAGGTHTRMPSAKPSPSSSGTSAHDKEDRPAGLVRQRAEDLLERFEVGESPRERHSPGETGLKCGNSHLSIPSRSSRRGSICSQSESTSGCSCARSKPPSNHVKIST